MRAAVVNASPLIFLAKIGQLEALHLFSPVLTTKIVLTEVEAGLESGHKDPLAVRREVAQGRLRVRRAPALRLPPMNLDPGELSVIALAAATKGAVAVVDDLPAIRAARNLQIAVRSTPFVLLDNVIQGRISSLAFKDLLDGLLRQDYRLSPTLYTELLAEAEVSGRPRG